MEDVFKAMGDALNPNTKPVINKFDAFDALYKAINEIPDIHIRINLMNKLIDYITSNS